MTKAFTNKDYIIYGQKYFLAFKGGGGGFTLIIL